MPRCSVGGTQLISMGPRKIVVKETLESGWSAVCEPATVAHNRLGTPIRIKDLDSGEQCSRVDRTARSVNDLGSKDVIIRIEGDAVFLSYCPVVTLSNGIAINPESIVIIPSNDNFCGDGIWTARTNRKVVAEISNGVGWYGCSIILPDPIGLAEI